MTHEAANFININYFTKCQSKELQNTNKCGNIKVRFFCVILVFPTFKKFRLVTSSNSKSTLKQHHAPKTETNGNKASALNLSVSV